MKVLVNAPDVAHVLLHEPRVNTIVNGPLPRHLVVAATPVP